MEPEVRGVEVGEPRQGEAVRVARGGGDGQRHRARGAALLRRHVPHVLRLHARRAAHFGPDEAAVDLGLHARLDRPRRGRADPSVRRAPAGAAGDPPPERPQAGRRERDRARLEVRPQHDRRSDGVRALAPERADAGPVVDPRRRHRARRVRAARLRRRRHAGRDPARHGLRGRALPRGGREARRRRRGRARRVDAVHGHLHARGRGVPRGGAPRGLPRPGGGRGRQPARVGQVDRRGGLLPRHGDVRRVRAREGRVRALRHHVRPPGRARQEDPGAGGSDHMTVTQGVNERLATLTSLGTSVWLDQIRRSLIEGGELQRLIDEYSLRGVTSNPAIFEKAILGSDDYDDELREMAGEGLGPREIYENIAIRDVQMAADVLRPLYDETDGYDGYVSLEVMPDLAHDAEATLAQAREYWRRCVRPNVMIKIPGTEEGLTAIEHAIGEGINVNVTLLFSVDAYEKVAGAYILGLERRRDAGESLDVHSVASFFVSRVDSEVDKRLEAAGNMELQGRAGVGT